MAFRMAHRPPPEEAVAVAEVPGPREAAVGGQEVEGPLRSGRAEGAAVVEERRSGLDSLHLASGAEVVAHPVQVIRSSQAPGRMVVAVAARRQSSGRERQSTCCPWQTVDEEGPSFRTG